MQILFFSKHITNLAKVWMMMACFVSYHVSVVFVSKLQKSFSVYRDKSLCHKCSMCIWISAPKQLMMWIAFLKNGSVVLHGICVSFRNFHSIYWPNFFLTVVSNAELLCFHCSDHLLNCLLNSNHCGFIVPVAKWSGGKAEISVFRPGWAYQRKAGRKSFPHVLFSCCPQKLQWQNLAALTFFLTHLRYRSFHTNLSFKLQPRCCWLSMDQVWHRVCLKNTVYPEGSTHWPSWVWTTCLSLPAREKSHNSYPKAFSQRCAT